ncbi:MAG: TonB-dependent receptor [Cyclobacteriaceae bacterium]|nr:TonB-dependent receptor [Cyclobacteriaceae bacterium]
MSKFVFYGIVLQAFFLEMLIANGIHAQNTSSIRDVMVNVQLTNVTLEDVFRQLERSTEFRFTYDIKDVRNAGRVDINLGNRSVFDVLQEISKQAGFHFRQMNNDIDVKKITRRTSDVPVIEVVAQTRTITGRITDAADNTGLPGVNILERGTSNGTVTDVDGRYSITVADGAVLIISSVGYITEEVNTGNRSVIDLVISPDVTALEEIVVVGYGTQKRSDLTGSVSSVSGQDLSRIAVPRMDQALQGQAAGVQITNVQSQPGGEVSIRIRGQNSISGNNNPLIVIDGILGGDLRMINPQDIESLEVLKDASATAIYGSRGSNGVILVTTRRGKSGAPRVEINSHVAMQEIRKTLPLLNAQQHMDVLMNLPENVQTQIGWASILPTIDPTIDTDWQREVFQNAPQHEHQVSISGGTDKTRYSVMGNFFSQQGIIKNSMFERGSLRINLDQEITDRLRMGVSLNLARFKRDNLSLDTEGGSQGGSVTTSATQFSPMRAPFDRDGNYSLPLDPGAQLNNPITLINERPNFTTRNFIQGALFVDYDITKDLVFRTNLAFTNTDNLQQGYASRQLLEAAGQGVATISNFTLQDWLIENILTYSKRLGDIHNLSVMGGFTAQGIQQFNSSITGRGFSTEVNNFNNIQQAAILLATSSFRDERMASFLGRVNYSLKDRYLLTVNVRADGSSKFATENKWGVFPSAAAGWRISEEDFMQNVSAVSNLKLRGSWGLVGSQAINPYQSLASFSTIANAYSWGNTLDVVGVGAGRIPNPFLRWETTEQSNIGLDVGFLQDRIMFTADVYEKITRDLLYGRQLPLYTGYSSQTDNIGSIRNWGIELGINTVNTRANSAVEWTTNANFSINRNKVLNLGDDTEFFTQAISTLGWGRQEVITRVGEPLGSFFGYVFDGIYQNAEEVAAINHPGSRPGTVRFKDVNGDGRITPDDQIIIGDPNPDFFYGITNNLRYRNFDLSIFFQGVQGGDVLNLTRARLESPGINNSLVSSLDYWRGEGTSNTVQAPGEANGGMSTRWLEDGSYLRLKNLMIGYNLPEAALQRLKLRSLRIYTSGVNLLTFTNYTGYDPEVNFRGDNNILMNIDHGGFPVFRTYTLGINIGL